MISAVCSQFATTSIRTMRYTYNSLTQPAELFFTWKNILQPSTNVRHAHANLLSRLAGFGKCLASCKTKQVRPIPPNLLTLISKIGSQLQNGDDRRIQRCQLRRKHHPRREPAHQALRLPPPRNRRRQIHHPEPCLQSILQRPFLRQPHINALHKRHNRRSHDSTGTLFFQRRGRFTMRDSTRRLHLYGQRAPDRRLYRLPGQSDDNFQLRCLRSAKAVHRPLPFLLHQ